MKKVKHFREIGFVSDCFFLHYMIFWTILYWIVLYGTVLYMHRSFMLGDFLRCFFLDFLKNKFVLVVHYNIINR